MTSIVTPDGGGDLPLISDPANALLARTGNSWVVGKIPAPDGEAGVLTIRTPDVTLTLLLTKAEVAQRIEVLCYLRDVLSGTSLVIPPRGAAMRIAGVIRDSRPG